MTAEIIIVRYGQKVLEDRCIHSVCLHTDLRRHKLTVVDNYWRDKNLGALWNELIEKSSHPWICLLNSDTEVEAEWIDKMIETGESNEADAVGPITNKCGYAQQMTAPQKRVLEVKQLSGFCVLIRRSAWEKASGFREDFPFYGQESNLMTRIGLKLVSRDVFVRHEGGATVKANGRAKEEREMTKWFWPKQVKFDWSKRLAIIGSGPGNPFPLWKGIDQAIKEFSREGMAARHFRFDVTRGELANFRPDVVLVTNTHRPRVAEFRKTLKGIPAIKALWFNDLRDAQDSGILSGMFDRIFLCFQSSPEFEWKDWYLKTGAEISYMPQGSVINTELAPLDIQRRAVFIGDTNGNNRFHEGRKELAQAIGAEVFNRGQREDRIEVEKFSDLLYRQSMFSLCMSPVVRGYHSLRLYNVLAYGGLALVQKFPGLERLFEEGKHFLGFKSAREAIDVMDSWGERGQECERIRRAGWRYQQAKHTVAMRLLNMVTNLTTSDQSFWGYV